MLPFLFAQGWVAKTAALLVFIVASLTDWLDGYLARRWGQTNPLGALLDPIADKVLVLGTFLAFVQLGLVPAWMVLVIALREFLLTGVRLFAASRHIVLAAAREGKHKTVSQMVTIIVIFAAVIAREADGSPALPEAFSAVLSGLVSACLWVTVALTVVSGASFFRRHWRVLRDAVAH
jgi:CDP-diacylglycerol--glycerol-3-phosphate 3-phosphatidyltransferase